MLRSYTTRDVSAREQWRQIRQGEVAELEDGEEKPEGLVRLDDDDDQPAEGAGGTPVDSGDFSPQPEPPTISHDEDC
jgi:hypothetical protein